MSEESRDIHEVHFFDMDGNRLPKRPRNKEYIEKIRIIKYKHRIRKPQSVINDTIDIIDPPEPIPDPPELPPEGEEEPPLP